MWIFLAAIIFIIIVLFLIYTNYSRTNKAITVSEIGNKIKLTWNAVSGAVSYKIKVGKESKTYDKEYTSNTNSFEIERDPCRAYYMLVNTVTSTCISPNSDEVSVGKLDIKPKITAVENSIISWTGVDVKTFTIYLNDKEVGKTPGNIKQYKLTNVPCGTQNVVKVEANIDSCSSVSNSYSFTLKNPEKPSNIKIID